MRIHPTKPAAQQDREDHILYIACPEIIVLVVRGVGGDGGEFVDALDFFLDGDFCGFEDGLDCDC